MDAESIVLQQCRFIEDVFMMGDDAQKISILCSLPQLAAADSVSTYNRIIPKIQQDLPHSSCEIQITASRVFKMLIESQMNASILASIIQGVDAKDPNVSTSWSEALIGLVMVVNDETLRTTMLPLARTKSAPNNSVPNKILCSRIVGQICIYPRLKTIDVRKDILPIVLSLCQDVSSEVRAAVCYDLPFVAQGLGNAFVKTNLLPSLVELACDENCDVRGASISAIALVMKYLDADTKSKTMVPLIKQLCDKSTRKEDTTALILSTEFSTILSGLFKCIGDDDIKFMLKAYKGFSQRGKSGATKVDTAKEVMCREKCASNLSRVLEFVKKTVPDEMLFVYGIFKELAGDPCYLVRRSAAGSMAGIASILGQQNNIMKNEIVRLLRDDAVEVLELLVPTLASLLLSLCDYGSLDNAVASQMTMDIGRAIFKCQTEMSKGYNWRLMVTFLIQLECLPFCMPSEFIHTNITPVLLDKVTNGRAKPVKVQAIRTLVIFMRYNFKVNQNKWLRDSLLKTTLLSENSYNRKLSGHLCESMLDVYSESYFKEHVLQPVLTLSNDKIIGVRYVLVMLSTSLKQMSTLGTDGKSAKMITDTFTKMETSEKSRVVQELLKLKKKDPPGRRIEERLKEEARRVKEESSGVIRRATTGQVGQKVAAPVAAAVKTVTPEVKPQQQPQQQQQQQQINKPQVPPNTPQQQQHPKPESTIAKPDSSVEVVEIVTATVLSDLQSLDVNKLSELKTTNITDDVKVNLRKISRLTQPKNYKGKRYSSVISVDCFMDADVKQQHRRSYSSVISMDCFSEKDRKLQHRRSLNFGREVSRIPVCSSLKGKCTEEDVCRLGMEHKQLSASDSKLDCKKDRDVNKIDYKKPENATDAVKIRTAPSNLPVYIRKPTGNQPQPAVKK